MLFGQENVIHVNVNLVQMDAVVTDSHGNPVENLTADDFEILQDGRPQKITNFSFVSTKPKPQPRPAKGKPIPPPPFLPKPSEIHRTIALVVDDLGLSFESIARVRGSLKKFVDTQVQPGDLVAVIRTGAGMGSLQQFTTDKRVLYAAIDHVKYNPLMSRVGISTFEPLGGSGDSEGIAQLRSSVFSVGTLGAIRYVVDGLRELPGRKTLVLFSENLQLFHRNDPDPRVMDGVRALVDAANRASVVIYSIDTRGLEYYGATAADNTSGMSARQISRIPQRRAAQVFRSQDGLVLLAHDTGGKFYANNNDMLGQVEQAVRDSEGYYLIAYHPPDNTFDQRTGRPKFHSVKVRVKAAGLTVRSRAGFLNHSDALTEAPARTPREQIRKALYSPFGSGAIRLRLTPLFTNSAKDGSFITGLLHFDGKDLTFTDQPDGWHKAVVDVVSVTVGDQGQVVDSISKSFTMTLKTDAYETTLRDGLFVRFRHPVQKPGFYTMRVAVRDEGSQKVGSANQFIEVPDVSKNLTLSSLMLEKETPAAKPGPGDNSEGAAPQQDPKGNPVLRTFKQGDELAYVYQIFNADVQPRQGGLEVHTRLFRDGQQVYEGKPMPLQTVSQPDPKHIVAAGAMKLGVHLSPGDYVLQVIVTDKTGDKSRTATQSTDFEVEP
jgi:VWFA-related protein